VANNCELRYPRLVWTTAIVTEGFAKADRLLELPVCAEHSSPELAPTAKDVLVLVNPKAGARSRPAIVQQTMQHLAEMGYCCEIVTDLELLAEMAASRLERGSLRTVIAAGGDGTVSVAANRTPHGTPLTVLPLGTENLLAKYLGIPRDARQISRIVDRGCCVQLDAGRANGQLFLLMVGCGFDAEVVRRVDQARAGHITHFSYFKPILDSIRSYQYPDLRIYSQNPVRGDEMELSVTARWAFVANLPRYARGLNMVPQACGTDGLLDVCTFRRGSLLRGLVYLARIFWGTHQSLEDCVSLQSRRLRIEADSEVPYQLDGDAGGTLPVELEVVPRRLTVLIPENRRGSLVAPRSPEKE
jgi:YegS/Rv2252/BmrU family lipid kinase